MMMIFAIIKGLWTTFIHLFRKPITVQYPKETIPPSPRSRGRHRLRLDKNGLELCIGCELCAGVCPSKCIYIEAEENDPNDRKSEGERYAKVYRIDMYRCIFCGYCVEACPTDALILSANYDLTVDSRRKFVWNKEDLVDPPETRTDIEGYYIGWK
ncbi:MAG: NADH-quinone oxidoreductase subunit NuoI [bacterium]